MPPVFRELLNDDAVVLDVNSGRATRKFRVTVALADQATAETDIDAATPNLGDPHPAYPALKYKGYEIRRVNNWRTSWEVQYNYEYEGFGTLDNESPFDRDPEVSWFSRVENREFFKDVNGIEAVNTAGVPFEPSPVALAISTGLTYVRNERQTGVRWNTIMTWMAGRRVGVNSDSFTIDGQNIPAQLAIMWIDRIDRIKEGDTVYRRTAYNFEFVPDRTVTGPVGPGTTINPAKAQHVLVSNVGKTIKDSGDPTKLKPITIAGTATQESLFIDGAGTARSTTETNRVYQAYPLYPFAPFGFS